MVNIFHSKKTLLSCALLLIASSTIGTAASNQNSRPLPLIIPFKPLVIPGYQAKLKGFFAYEAHCKLIQASATNQSYPTTGSQKK